MDDLDPIKRFNRIRRSASPDPSPAMSPAAVRTVISDAQANNADVGEATANYLALNTPLTKQAAQQVVTAASDGSAAPDPDKVVAGAAAASGGSGEVELSDPVMLWPAARTVFAVVFAATLVLSMVFAYLLADQAVADQPKSAWAYGALGIGAAVSVLGLLVLVMGYKNVTIKGSGPSA